MNSQGCLRLRAATAARGLAALLARSAPPPLATPSSGRSPRLRGAGLRSRATACKGRAAFGRGDPRPRSALSGVAPPLRPLRSPSGPRSSLFVRTLRAALPKCEPRSQRYAGSPLLPLVAVYRPLRSFTAGLATGDSPLLPLVAVYCPLRAPPAVKCAQCSVLPG